MRSHKLQIKLYLADPEGATPQDVVPVFHRWIRERVFDDELLIDVVDYSHVHHGPGAVLVGHEAMYGLDQSEGRPGLLYTRKRETDGATEADRLARAFRAALRAARLLEEDPDLAGRVRFRTDEILFRIQDRLSAPGDAAATQAEVEPELRAFLGRLYPGPAILLEPASTPREPFALRLRPQDAPPVAHLAARI